VTHFKDEALITKTAVGSTFAALLTLFPASVGSLRFIQLTTPLSISAEKSHPPYIAFSEVERLQLPDEWDQFERQTPVQLSTEKTAELKSEALVLNEENFLRLEVMKVTKAEIAETPDWSNVVYEPVAAEWRNDLSKFEAKRIREAEARGLTIDEKWAPPTWSEQALKTLSENAAKLPTTALKEDTSKQIVIGSGMNADGSIRVAERSVARVDIQERPNDELEIQGNFQISGGLGFTNEHYFEIRRRNEGIDQEQGVMNLKAGSYAIRLKGRSGELVARIRDQKHRVLGEASLRLSRLDSKLAGKTKGPTLVLTPRTDIAGQYSPVYSVASTGQSKPGRPVLAALKGAAFSGASEMSISKSGEFEFENVQKGSFTVLKGQAKGYAQTLALVPAGSRADLPLFPETMIESLKTITSDQRQMSLDDPTAPVIWGKVSLDGRMMAGVTVEIESAPGLQPIYFNQFLLPDSTLKSTSENGLYAFISVPAGFHSLMAKRGDAYFAHQNVVTERGSVSVAELASSLRTEKSILRVYDAFTGEPRPAILIHQAADRELQVGNQGSISAVLPFSHRLSLVQLRPEAPYVSANYLVDDAEGYAHLPLVRGDWLLWFKSNQKMDDDPSSSIVVGFVPDENFTADVLDPQGRTRIIYFDGRGLPTGQDKGVAGGGFLIYGLSPGVREIMIFGEETGLLSSRVVPSDPSGVNVLMIRAE
jgi:hypothetical protein